MTKYIHVPFNLELMKIASYYKSKREIVEGLDGGSLCLGNGFNDIPMFEVAALSIAILEGEGMAPGLLNRADILSRSILEALDIASDASKVKATLRN